MYISIITYFRSLPVPTESSVAFIGIQSFTVNVRLIRLYELRSHASAHGVGSRQQDKVQKYGYESQ